MNLDFKIVGNDICIKLSGEIDEYSARSLRADIDKLIEAQGFRTMTARDSDCSSADTKNCAPSMPSCC